jgi:hypothetical protein
MEWFFTWKMLHGEVGRDPARMRRFFAFALLSGALAHGEALAQERVLPQAPNEASALAAQIEAELQSLQTAARPQGGDCPTACRALDSMRRATERLCAIEPGERCAEALRKVADAAQRVAAACPTCPESLATAPQPHGAAKSFEASAETTQATSAPPGPHPTSLVASEETRKRGGCAGCTTTPWRDGSSAGILGGAVALVLLARRRRRPEARG